ncbi:hypothetical protein [Mesorhizobium sp. M6A.T.Ce.TU.016.01.1.1]|uniref:helix-turn-helix transcriptional regulator n=1 Tax=Mesorhizobium sp. M6A.T.Ce.TU.016.01.1.1 TaxID=2496783 RepID=UPI00163BF9ED|nr:hypothetical protein [Mesorhizobium sp. M6A.T.Ce.TU.016.01.1.1]
MTMITCELIHALPFEARRGCNRREAASYVGVSPTHFDKLVRNGTFPGPFELLGRKVWDVQTLDRAVDAMSGIETLAARSPVRDEDDLDRELAAFETKHHGHA